MIRQSAHRLPDRFRSFLGFWNAETSRGEEEAAAFLALSPAEQRRAQPGFGALQRILQKAHEELDSDPRHALDLTLFAVRRAMRLVTPDGCDHLRRMLVGRAWKEHANALLALSHLDHAELAARRALRHLAEDVLEQHAVVLVQANIAADRRDFAEAMQLVQTCLNVFAEHGDARRSLQALSMEAIILIRSGRRERAAEVLHAAKIQAEELGDRRERARILNNLGHCEQQLGRTDAAMRSLRQALQEFDREGMSAERQRAVWGFARVLRDRGNLPEAAEALRVVRRELLGRGMVVEAALAGVDLLELLDAAEAAAEVTSVARELVAEFSNAGMQQELRIAFAYLADQQRASRRDSLETPLREVRAFFNELTENPGASFRIDARATGARRPDPPRN